MILFLSISYAHKKTTMPATNGLCRMPVFWGSCKFLVAVIIVPITPFRLTHKIVCFAWKTSKYYKPKFARSRNNLAYQLSQKNRLANFACLMVVDKVWYCLGREVFRLNLFKTYKTCRHNKVLKAKMNNLFDFF